MKEVLDPALPLDQAESEAVVPNTQILETNNNLPIALPIQVAPTAKPRYVNLNSIANANFMALKSLSKPFKVRRKEALPFYFDRARLEATVTNLTVLEAYKNLMRACSKIVVNASDVRLIEQAFLLAYVKHNGQLRKTGEPYILHPIAVARIVAEEIKLEDATAIAAALLHDVVEDTDTSLEEIERSFGKVVAKIVDGLTKIKRASKKQTEIQNLHDKRADLLEKKDAFIEKAENLKRILLTLCEDMRVFIIKIADRVHNMRTMDSMLAHKQLEIASETLYIYAPTAHKLGLYSIKSELEDLCMKYTIPDEYREIKEKLQTTKAKREAYIKDFIEPLREKIKQEIPDLPNFRIFGRAKHIYSIYNKIKTKGVAFEEIYDLFAIRIVVDSTINNEKADCWKIYSKVTDLFATTGDRLRDWLTNPRSNGYQSLHTTVINADGRPVEIQIRSENMDAQAERGVAAHWIYKGNNNKSAFDAFIENISAAFQDQFNSVEAISNVRHALFEKEIHVFTPKGAVRTLPIGATVLDFAFDIHTDLGCSCIGGEIDGKLYRINHVLANGQQVKIITSKKQVPHKEWLSWAKTTKARAKINSVLKSAEFADSKEGQEILERKLNQWKLPTTDNFIQNLAAYFRYKDRRAFFADIFLKKIDIQLIKKLKIEGEKILSDRNTKQILTKGNENVEKKAAPINSDNGLTLSGGLDKIDYNLAKCCQPVAGDSVFGFITIGQGITIHRTNCTNAISLRTRFPYRVVNINWNTEDKEEPFLATLLLKGIDDVGLVNRITTIISNDLKINMRAISLNARDGIFEGKLEIYVKNIEELDNLVKHLKQIGSIHTIKRVG